MRTFYVPYRSVSLSVAFGLLTLVGASGGPECHCPLVRGLSLYILLPALLITTTIIRGINSTTTANNPDSAQDGRKLAHFLPYVQAKGRQGSHWLQA